ncbi:hypothetical protein A2U01_0118095, partial [Trifolium medium]|nr:hypothetical protein [Trifolium medium]
TTTSTPNSPQALHPLLPKARLVATSSPSPNSSRCSPTGWWCDRPLVVATPPPPTPYG